MLDTVVLFSGRVVQTFTCQCDDSFLRFTLSFLTLVVHDGSDGCVLISPPGNRSACQRSAPDSRRVLSVTSLRGTDGRSAPPMYSKKTEWWYGINLAQTAVIQTDSSLHCSDVTLFALLALSADIEVVLLLVSLHLVWKVVRIHAIIP